jgi:formylglycine-generating enzyme required for sulfatase activity
MFSIGQLELFSCKGKVHDYYWVVCCAFRDWNGPDFRQRNAGFRVCVVNPSG